MSRADRCHDNRAAASSRRGVSTPDGWETHYNAGVATEARIIKDKPDQWQHLMLVCSTGPSGGKHDDYIRTTPSELREQLEVLGDLAHIEVAEAVVEMTENTLVGTVFTLDKQGVLVRSFLARTPPAE